MNPGHGLELAPGPAIAMNPGAWSGADFGPGNSHESGAWSVACPGPGNNHESGAGSAAGPGPCNRQDIRPDPCGTAEPEYHCAPVQEQGCSLSHYEDAAAGRTDHFMIAWSGSSLTLPCPLFYPSHSACYNRQVTVSLLLQPCRHALCRLGRTARAAALCRALMSLVLAVFCSFWLL